MRAILQAMKFGAIVFAAGVFLMSGISLSQAQTGTVRIHGAKAGFIIGVGGGSGTLTYKGKSYPLRVGGLSAGTIGVATVDLVGTARNLRRPQDIAGTYSAVGASLAVAGGRKVATLQNEKGVVLELRGREVGFEASLNLSGVTISMQ